MISKKDGGPAFPGKLGDVGFKGDIKFYDQGMSLRDYFAAKAMQGIIAKLDGAAAEVRTAFLSKPIAEDAYKIADEMLLERDK